MAEYEIKINYLYNSGFAVETKRHLLIFDYFSDRVDSGERKLSNGVVYDEDLKTDKKIIVLSSHSHHDHFNKVIFDWMNTNPDITYVLSSDIRAGNNYDNVYKIAPYDELNLADVYIKAFGSTDIGVSFLVNVDGISVFHSGDLNWWYWWDDTDSEKLQGEKMFKHEIAKIAGNKIDVAFFPIDPRLRDYYYLGGEYFIKEIKPQIFIPMHFGDNYGITEDFAKVVKELPVKIVGITKRGQEILI